MVCHIRVHHGILADYMEVNNMFCFKCGKYINGVTNKIRHMLADNDQKLNYDCGKYQEIKIQKVIYELDHTNVNVGNNKVTLREFMKLIKPEPHTKINHRNHNSGTRGTSRFLKPE